MKKRRDIAMAIILTLITCGIYGIYWFVVMTDEINAVSGSPFDTSGVMALILTVVTCGLYSIYWAYKMGEKLDRATGQNASRGIMYLILSLVGFGIIAYALMQDSLNKI